MFGIKLILIILVASGVIAYVGDYLGRFLGRRRLTLLGLRPRYTAILFTIISGVLIAAITAGILILSSQDVRTAFFGLERLKSEISLLKADLNSKALEKERLQKEIKIYEDNLLKAKTEIQKLSEVKVKLENEIKVSRSGLLLFRVGDVLVVSIIEGGLEEEVILVSLKNMLEGAVSLVQKLYPSTKKALLDLPASEMSQALNYLTSKEGRIIVRLVAAQNVVFGQKIPLHFEMFKNELVFHKGDVILSAVLDGRKAQQDVETDIKDMLVRVNLKAREKGVLPDREGSIGTISYPEMFKAVKEIVKKNRFVSLKVVSATDVYTLGPLMISFMVE